MGLYDEIIIFLISLVSRDNPREKIWNSTIHCVTYISDDQGMYEKPHADFCLL